MGSVQLLTDPNYRIHNGAPTCTGGMIEAKHLCNVLGIQLQLSPIRKSYMHGWGSSCHGAKPTACSWTFTTTDINNRATDLTFDLIRGSSPLILGLRVIQFSNQLGSSANIQLYISISGPTDKQPRLFHTYIRTDDRGSDLSIRKRIRLSPSWDTNACALPSKFSINARRSPLVLSRKLHRFTHPHPDEVKRIGRDAGILAKPLDDAIIKVDEAGEVCAKSGTPKPLRKVSLAHINENLNEEVQIDFMFQIIRDAKRTVFVMTDTGNGYKESVAMPNRSISMIIQALETPWFYQHGMPRKASADDEFNHNLFQRFLQAQNIE